MEQTTSEEPQASHKPLSGWLRRISEEEMPIFGHTVQQVVNASDNDSVPAVELARVILRDASMTTRVLKLANSVYYNPRRQGISTVSRAVVVLGFTTVRNMCLSIALVDAFTQGSSRDRLTEVLARSIHAATQARAVAIALKDDIPEEGFIASLLYHLGDMAFWCFSGDIGEKLDERMKEPGYTPEQAEKEVLGFHLRELSASLAEEWHINDLLISTLKGVGGEKSRRQNIQLCHQLAEAAEQGWDAPEVRGVLLELAELTAQSEKAITQLTQCCAKEASNIASAYGAVMAAKVIPLPRQLPNDGSADSEEDTIIEEFSEPDGILQLKILRELSMLLDTHADFNLVMELVLEGISRGIGMDRTLFALVSPDRKQLKAKSMLGHGDDKLLSQFLFKQDPHRSNIFFETLESRNSVWVDLQQQPDLINKVPANVIGVIGKNPFFVAPIVVCKRCIGLFYADRALSGRALDEDSFESFKHFAQQANLGLTHLSVTQK